VDSWVVVGGTFYGVVGWLWGPIGILVQNPAAQLMPHDLPVTFACLLCCWLKLKLHYGPEQATYWVQIWVGPCLGSFRFADASMCC